MLLNHPGFPGGSRVGRTTKDSLVVASIAGNTKRLSSWPTRRIRAARAPMSVIVPVGIFVGSTIGLGAGVLGLALGTFAGIFVAVGVGHLLPETRHGHHSTSPGIRIAGGCWSGRGGCHPHRSGLSQPFSRRSEGSVAPART